MDDVTLDAVACITSCSVFFLMPLSQVPVFCVLSLKVLLLKMPFADDAADEMVLLF